MTTAEISPTSISRQAAQEQPLPLLLARVTDKASGRCLGYVVSSRTRPGIWYQVTAVRCDGAWRYCCTCQAGQHGKACWHVRAVLEDVRRRRAARQTQQPQAQAAQPAELVVAAAPLYREAFSLLK